MKGTIFEIEGAATILVSKTTLTELQLSYNRQVV